MKSDRQPPRFRVEYGLIAATALSACGQFHVVFLSFVAWFVLRQARPKASPLVVMVTSTFVAYLMLTLVDLAHLPMLVPVLIETLGVSGVALLLFLSGAAIWSYILIAHSAFVIVVHSLSLWGAALSGAQQRLACGAIVLKAFVILALVWHLRGAALAPAQPQPPPDENG
jgi:hypothetical protein